MTRLPIVDFGTPDGVLEKLGFQPARQRTTEGVSLPRDLR